MAPHPGGDGVRGDHPAGNGDGLRGDPDGAGLTSADADRWVIPDLLRHNDRPDPEPAADPGRTGADTDPDADDDPATISDNGDRDLLRPELTGRLNLRMGTTTAEYAYPDPHMRNPDAVRYVRLATIFGQDPAHFIRVVTATEVTP